MSPSALESGDLILTNWTAVESGDTITVIDIYNERKSDVYTVHVVHWTQRLVHNIPTCIMSTSNYAAKHSELIQNIL